MLRFSGVERSGRRMRDCASPCKLNHTFRVLRYNF